MMKDPRLQSPTEETRVHRSEWHPEPYLSPDYVQEKQPLRPLRFLSPPPELERSGRILDGYRRGSSIERDRGFYDGRDERAFSGSPPFGQSLKWSHIDEEISYREGRPRREYRNLYDEHFGGSRNDQEENLEGSNRAFFIPPKVVGPVLNSGRNGGSFPSSSSGKVSIHREEDELRFLNKLQARVSYDEENEPLGDVYDPMLVSSHPKDFGSLPSSVSKDSFIDFNQDTMRSYRFGRRQEKYSDFEGQDGYSEAPPSDFARDPDLYSNDHPSRHYDPLSSARQQHRENNYHEHGRREDGTTVYRSNKLHRQDQLIERGAYTSRNSLRPSLSGSAVDEVQYIESSRKKCRESNSRGHHSQQGELLSDYRVIKSNRLAEDRRGEFFGPGTKKFTMKLSSDLERTHSGRDYGFGRDAGPLSHKERLKRLQMTESDHDMFRLDLSSRRRLKAEELSYEPTERLLKRRYPIDEEMSRHSDRNILLSDRITSRQVEELSCIEEQWSHENPGGSFSSKRLRYSNLQYQKSGRQYEGRIAGAISASDDWSSSRDLPEHVQRRAINHYATGDENVNIKRRLRPCPSNYHSSYPMDERQDFYKPDRTWKRNVDNQYDVLTNDGNPLEDAEVQPDLHEDSNEFKQLVENLFLQFSKRLNENPSTRRRYREEGKAGSLLCVVCGRLSKEFLDTRSLVTHTFMSCKVGKRTHHLALNKAICVLMGWKSVITPNGACVYEVLPEAEAFTLKEDLILWPPLVIIHNSSIINNNADARQVITIEHMEVILRGLGFSGGKIKVRYGKPANQSIMVVKFLPTFSGLQEAEKLHKYYLENKRGRAEFQKLVYNNRNIVNEKVAGIPEERVEHVLHGYMGIAEDLDKLDFDTKKKSVVKSKKDIQAIADAPLKK